MELPSRIVVHILSLAQAKDVINYSLISRDNMKYLENVGLWEVLYQRDCQWSQVNFRDAWDKNKKVIDLIPRINDVMSDIKLVQPHISKLFLKRFDGHDEYLMKLEKKYKKCSFKYPYQLYRHLFYKDLKNHMALQIIDKVHDTPNCEFKYSFGKTFITLWYSSDYFMWAEKCEKRYSNKDQFKTGLLKYIHINGVLKKM